MRFTVYSPVLNLYQVSTDTEITGIGICIKTEKAGSVHLLTTVIDSDWNLAVVSGIPRHLDSQDGYLRKEAKQMKREGSPLRGPGSLSDHVKGRETMVPTVKEAGRSIHLIPREELRQPGKEGIVAQVNTH